MPEAIVDCHLTEDVPIVGQTPLDLTRLDGARKLKAIINVETNFLPDIDYGYRAERGVYVLTPSAAFALQGISEIDKLSILESFLRFQL